ncbi:MAG: HPP family protein [Pseudonocardia sp.]|jgi:hypothetical protein|nr:HPP family protein [Pseudonocardia sp.]MBN9096976.1 HPP family protein [Pseudonocardia sp.]OJY46275.1 MAG: hypothetical protein BGP03_22845 [Pseudonocardia sp. 73-21]
MGVRGWVAVRLAVLAGALLAGVGVADHYLGGLGGVGGVWLTATLGPTAYVFLAHPTSVTARLRNALIGHGVAVGAGVAALALFGLWSSPAVTQLDRETLPQAGAQALSIALTVALLTLLGAHHAPAAATTLLVASGIARPGPPLYGLLIGLGIVLLLGPLLARVPGLRPETATEYRDRTG